MTPYDVTVYLHDGETVRRCLSARDEIDALWRARRDYDTATAVEVRGYRGTTVLACWGNGERRNA